jgi:protein-tyrosine phosphatase
MIDLHLHLLPAVDDGPSATEESEAMLDLAVTLGFERLVTTPHLDGPLQPAYVHRVQTALAEIEPLVAARGIQLSSGFEIQLSPDIPSRLERGEPLRLAGSHTVLVELPFSGWPMHAEGTLFAVQAAGFRVLLAHPERYVAIHRELDRALTLADRGVLLQVTFASLAGLFGKVVQQTAEALVRRDAATILASDAHSAGQRFRTVTKGYERAVELLGEARAGQLVRDNPAALLADLPLPASEPIEATKTQGGWRSRLRR